MKNNFMKKTLQPVLISLALNADAMAQDLVVPGHIAVGNMGQIDGGPTGADHNLIFAEEYRTDTDRNFVGITSVPIWAPAGSLPIGRGLAGFDTLVVAGPDFGQVLSYSTGFSANMSGAANKLGLVTFQVGFAVAQPIMNSVNVTENYGVLIKDQGTNIIGTGTIDYSCGLCIESQTQDGLIVKGGRNFILGSFGVGLKAVTESTYLANRELVILANASNNNVTISLPLASSVEVGREYVVKRIDATSHTLKLIGSGTDKIDGSATRTLGANTALRVISGGAGWYILASYP